MKLKWIAPLVDSLCGMSGAVVDMLVKAVQALAERYAVTFVDPETQISESEKALSNMLDEPEGKGYVIVRALQGRLLHHLSDGIRSNLLFGAKRSRRHVVIDTAQ